MATSSKAQHGGRDPFALPSDLHAYPADFRIRPLDFDIGPLWPRPIDRRPWSEEEDETPFTRDGLPGIGTLWLDWLGGARLAPRFVRRVFEGKLGAERLYAIDLRPDRRPRLYLDRQDERVVKAGCNQTVVITERRGPVGGSIFTKRYVRAVKREDAIERRLDLVALLLLTGTKRDPDKGVAIKLALDVANLAARRDDALRQGMLLGLLKRAGITEGSAPKVIVSKTRWKIGTLRANASRAQVKAVADAFAGAETVRADGLPHLADPWFAAGQEREVALGVAYRALECTKRGERPAELLRWALLVLCEGYWRRDRALPDEVVYALAACLELLDGEGCPRRDLTLAGVELRRSFMMFAASCAWDGFDDYYWPERPADADTEEAWLSHPMHVLAKEAVRAQLRRAG